MPCSGHSKLGGMAPEPEPWWSGGHGGDDDNAGSTAGSPVGSARHGGVGDRRGDAHPARPWVSCSATRTVCKCSPGFTPASRAQ